MSRVPVAVVRSTKSAVYKIITVFLFDHYLAWQVHVYKNIIALQANSIRGSQGACRKSRDVHVTPKAKVKRNEPCPCGSGKKYKKCCLLAAV